MYTNYNTCCHMKSCGDGWNEPKEYYCDLDIDSCEDCEHCYTREDYECEEADRMEDEWYHFDD